MTIELTTMYAAQPNSPSTTISGALNESTSAITVESAAVFTEQLSPPFLATIGYGTAYSETVLVTSVQGNVLTVTRGVDGDAAAWGSGTPIARMMTAKDLNDVQSNINALNTGKQDQLTIDPTPTQSSDNPVSSGGTYTAIQTAQAAAEAKIPSPASSVPVMDGTASAGSSDNYARADHVHPSDSTKADVSAIPAPSSSAPLMDGTASAGGSSNYARADHVHPSDTNKANISDVPSPSSSAPAMDGTASAGASSFYARADHVHPTDSSRQVKITATGILQGNGNGSISAAVAGTDYAPPYQYSTTDLTAGSSSLTTGTLYFVYE